MLICLLTLGLLALAVTVRANQTYTYQSQDPHFLYTPADMWDVISAPGATGGSAEFCLGDSTSGRANALIYFTFPVPATSFQYWGWQRSDGGLFTICFDCPESDTPPPGSPTIDALNATTNGTESPRLLYETSGLSYAVHTVAIVNSFDARATIGGSVTGGYGQMTLDRIVLTAPDTLSASSAASSSSSTQSSSTASSLSLPAPSPTPASSPSAVPTSQPFSALLSSFSQMPCGTSTSVTASQTSSANASTIGGHSTSASPPAIPTTSPNDATSSLSTLPCTTPSSNATALPAESSISTKTGNTGAIAGGVVAGAAALILVLLALLCWRRRRRESAELESQAYSYGSPLWGAGPYEGDESPTGAMGKPQMASLLSPTRRQERPRPSHGLAQDGGSQNALRDNRAQSGRYPRAGPPSQESDSNSSQGQRITPSSANIPAQSPPRRRSTSKTPRTQQPRSTNSSTRRNLPPVPSPSVYPPTSGIASPPPRETDAGWLAGEAEDGNEEGGTLPPDYEEATERRRRLAARGEARAGYI